MSKSDWLRHPAIGVAAFAAISFIVAALHNEGPIPSVGSDHRAEYDLTDTDNRTLSVEPPTRNPYPSRAEWRDEEDLQAQQWMMRWAAAMFFVTAAGVWYVAQTLNATRSAVDAAQDTITVTRIMGEKQVQAYLIASKGSLCLREVRGMLALSASVLIRNKGQSPASDIIITYKGFLTTPLDTSTIGTWMGYVIFDEDETFCRNIGPDDEDSAVMEFPPFETGSTDEMTFRGKQSRISIEGTIHWTNEFGNAQKQAFFMHGRPFVEGSFDAPEGRRHKKVDLVSGARRSPEDAKRTRKKYYEKKEKP